jgi:hypothetical protein
VIGEERRLRRNRTHADVAVSGGLHRGRSRRRNGSAMAASAARSI